MGALAPLPCPFCGHEADAGPIGKAPGYPYGVVCGNPDGCIVEAQATASSLAEAIAQWNTRTPVNSSERKAA